MIKLARGTTAGSRLFTVNAILVVLVAGSYWGRRIEGATIAQPEFLTRLQIPFRGWPTKDLELSKREMELLQPDAVLVRRYLTPDKGFAELAIIAGHRKKSVHTPGFCMSAGGWELLSQQPYNLNIGDRKITANRSIFSQKGQRMVATYYFTDGSFTTPKLVQFQMVQLLKRFQAGVPLGALVRILVPVTRDQAHAERLSDEFAAATLPTVMQSLRSTKLQVR